MGVACLYINSNKVQPETYPALRETSESIFNTNESKTPDLVLENLEALNSENRRVVSPSEPATNSHPHIQIIGAWGPEAEMFAANNNREHKPLLPSSVSPHADSELDDINGLNSTVDTDSTKQPLYTDAERDDIELHSLSSLEDENITFNSLQLVTSDVEHEPLKSRENSVTDLSRNGSKNAFNAEDGCMVYVNKNNDNNVGNAFKIPDSYTNPLEQSVVSNKKDGTEECVNHKSSITSTENETGYSIRSEFDEAIDKTYSGTLRIPESPARSPTQSTSSDQPQECIELLTIDSENVPGGQVNGNDDADNVSTTSEFRGSLGIDIVAGTWLCDNRVDLDIRLGRDEWSTTFKDTDGDTTAGVWDTTISEIAKSDAGPADWNVSLQDISNLDHIADREKWKTEIPDVLEHNEVPSDWSTRINKIEEVNQSRNTWSFVLRRIKHHVMNRNEWKTTFNTIRKNTVDKNEWKFKLPQKLTHAAHDSDWKTVIKELGNVTSKTDPWGLHDQKMIVTSDDRKTHWNTMFKDIEKDHLSLDVWNTKMQKIAPVTDENTWAFQLTELSNDLGTPDDWKVKFIDIEKRLNSDENEWKIRMNDVPDSYREETDWRTNLLDIAETIPEENPWDTTFNDISPNEHETDLWTNEFKSADITDMNRETWSTSFNDILPNENNELDWTVNIHAIEGLADGEEE